MDLGVLNTTFITFKYTQIVLYLAILGLSIHATTENVLYGILSMPTLFSFFVYFTLIRVKITNEVVKQERNLLFILFFMYAAILVVLSPAFLSIVKGNRNVSLNREKNLDAMTIRDANETFSHSIFRNLSKSELEKAIRKTNNTVNFGDRLSNKRTRKDEINDNFKFIYNIAMALIILMLVFQAILWALAWLINSQPVDNLDIEVDFQSEETLDQPILPANENLQVHPDSDEDSSALNVIIHRKPKASEEIDTESSMEDLDGVDYDSLTIVGSSIELETLRKQKKETVPRSNLTSTAFTSKSDSFLQKSGF